MSNADAFLSPKAEARVFWRMRGRLVANTLKQLFAGARLRLMVLIVVSLVFWALLFWLFLDAFQFLAISITNVASRAETVRIVFGLFFLTLLAMLVFSSGIILYGLLFRSQEPAFLLTLPARPERVFVHKFQEALIFSSWGFILLGSPMLVAFGLVNDAPWYFFAELLPFAVAFVCIPCAIGGMLCLAIVHWLPRLRLHALGVLAIAVILFAAWQVWDTLSGPRGNALTPAWFREMLVRLRASEQRLLPSWWLSTGLLEASARGEEPWRHARESLLFLTLTASNALVLFMAATRLARRWYRPAFDRLQSAHSSRRRGGALWLDGALGWAFRPLPRAMRLLLIKDLRVFRRDPLQWSQFLVFFGLLALYFVNMRPLVYNIGYETWANMISFLNLAVVGLILSTFTSRFIFPMLSLESRRFWILGRLPIRRDAILWTKFVFAFGCAILPCAVLVVTSDLMLQISPLLVGLHLLLCVLLSSGLSAIAVGLGARLPAARSESPSRIAAGFGGTLTLVISAVYIFVEVLLVALPCYYWQSAAPTRNSLLLLVSRWLDLGTVGGVVKGVAAAVVLGLAATALPLMIGIRAFRQQDL